MVTPLPALAGLSGWIDPRRQALLGLASGLVSGNTLHEGLGRGFALAAQGKQADDAYKVAEEAKAERAKQLNYTIQAFQKAGRQDLVDMANAGMMSEAWNAFNKPGPEPIKLGEGDTLLDPVTFKPLATGAPGGPETLITNNLGGTDKFYDEMDKALAGQTAGMIENGANARSNNIRLGQIEKLLETAPQGAQGVLTQVAGNLGIPVQGADEVQAAQALINQMVPGQRPPGSGTMSDADLALFKQSLPAIVNQPGGNKLIIQTAKAINEYYIAQSEIAERVANREISPAEGRKLAASVQNPLANFRAAFATGNTADPLGIR